MKVVTPEEYKMPDDGYDWCASCQYLAPVASTISADGIEPLQPICLECSTRMENTDVSTN